MKEIALYTLDIAQNSITAQARRLDITLTEEGKTITLSIRDDGTGMAPELLARVETVLRRCHKTDDTIVVGDVTVDTQSRVVKRAGEVVPLTAKEYALLLLFLQNRNIALFRETIYERVWGTEFTGDSRTVDLHVQRLRRKLGWQGKLLTIYKTGYRLEVTD